MTTEENTLRRIEKIEKGQGKLKWLIGSLIGLSLLPLLYFLKQPVRRETVIRTRGIVIEDENGKDRILIGAPIPYSANRVRTDTNLVRKYWAGTFPDAAQYMQWYKNYKHSANGMVVMNEAGFDVVLMGDDLADPNIGKRRYKSSGLLWNSQEGWERGGAGVNTTEDGKSRPTIGIDDDAGEAIHMVSLEDGSKGIIIGDEKGSLRIGMGKRESDLFLNQEAFVGFRFFDMNGKLLWEQQLQETQLSRSRTK
jgi:hypothetical protein